MHCRAHRDTHISLCDVLLLLRHPSLSLTRVPLGKLGCVRHIMQPAILSDLARDRHEEQMVVAGTLAFWHKLMANKQERGGAVHCTTFITLEAW